MSRKIDRRKQRQTKAKRQWIAYAGIAGGAILILALMALAFVSGNKPAEPLAGDDTIAMGKRVYEESCAACHGTQGEGHAAVAEAPALDETEHAWHHPDGQLQQLITNGGQTMPAFDDRLSNDEIVAVVRYLQSWWQPDQLAAQQKQSEGFPFQ